MKTEETTIDKIEERLWQLVLLAVVVILFLALALIALTFLGLFGKSEFIILSNNAYRYSIFMAILVLLFCGYMIVCQRKLIQLSRAFFKEKEAAATLGQDVKTLSSLLEVSSSINSQQKLSDILDIITREMLTCFQADQSSLMLLDKKSKLLETKAASGEGHEFTKDALIPMGKSIAGRVVESGKPLLLNGRVDPANFPGTEEKDRRISSAMSVPLKIGEENIGVLNVNIVDRDRTFSETDLQLISIFANNAAVAIHNSTLLEKKDEHIRLETIFEQFHSPRVAQELTKKLDAQDQPTEMRAKLEMTILFADIRGFTTVMALLKLEDIMDFLDEFYNAMTKTVFNNDGSIDKFIGDEVMAFFGGPVPLENSSESGVKAAMEMLASFQALKEKFPKNSPYFEDLGIGIGVTTGEVFVGNVGSRRHYDYTVIGSAVNLARRMCSYAESNQILATKKTLTNISGMVSSEFVENVSFKGIPEPVDIYKITSV